MAPPTIPPIIAGVIVDPDVNAVSAGFVDADAGAASADVESAVFVDSDATGACVSACVVYLPFNKILQFSTTMLR